MSARGVSVSEPAVVGLVPVQVAQAQRRKNKVRHGPGGQLPAARVLQVALPAGTSAAIARGTRCVPEQRVELRRWARYV